MRKSLVLQGAAGRQPIILIKGDHAFPPQQCEPLLGEKTALPSLAWNVHKAEQIGCWCLAWKKCDRFMKNCLPAVVRNLLEEYEGNNNNCHK